MVVDSFLFLQSLAVLDVPEKQHTLQKPRKSYASLGLLLLFRNKLCILFQT